MCKWDRRAGGVERRRLSIHIQPVTAPSTTHVECPMCLVVASPFEIRIFRIEVWLWQAQATVKSKFLVPEILETTYKAILEEKMVVFAAVFTHPIVRGTYGIVPPHAKPTQPFAMGETICKTVSKGAAVTLGRATPMVTPLPPVHPE